MLPDLNKFALEWIESWNSHDLDRILSHYADDVEVTTPMIKVVTGIDVTASDEHKFAKENRRIHE
jgi:ketosteroid isomerase-like protein